MTTATLSAFDWTYPPSIALSNRLIGRALGVGAKVVEQMIEARLISDGVDVDGLNHLMSIPVASIGPGTILVLLMPSRQRCNDLAPVQYNSEMSDANLTADVRRFLRQGHYGLLWQKTWMLLLCETFVVGAARWTRSPDGSIDEVHLLLSRWRGKIASGHPELVHADPSGADPIDMRIMGKRLVTNRVSIPCVF
ncbi:hypothetical protein [Nocardia fluminea]|uniref:Uncharacterized protein n=1 Tax=Nocardia fluminea TaxID=134984 RepID=A0A2N3V5A9_9NOCA|nr:hypothetical protein [Nocardia fluminea]PKV76805.1 hypothetical protein ATK86_7209 [Nocardia fluminea]